VGKPVDINWPGAQLLRSIDAGDADHRRRVECEAWRRPARRCRPAPLAL